MPTDAIELTVVVPTYNEAANVAPLVERLATALHGIAAEILFVDDSNDGTADEVRRVAAGASLPVAVLHRDEAAGGLSGAVILGLRRARARLCIVMDGDLQHPPEAIPRLLAARRATGADVVIASRYAGDGSSAGLADRTRTLVSRTTNLLTRAMFPLRLHGCTDPMTGYFLIDVDRIDLNALKPRGFKILLEILTRHHLKIAEIPFAFAPRQAERSKASLRHGMQFLTQLTALRFGKMSAFAVIGALGAVANLALMYAMISFGSGYIWAAVVAAEVTIVGNFLLQERFVFREMLPSASARWARFAKSFTFNNLEAAVRIPVIAFLVENWRFSSMFAAALTLAVAFIVRYAFHALVVYAPKR